MNYKKKPKPLANSFVTIMLAVALATACAGAMRLVTYRNNQTIIRNKIQKIEDQIRALHQDDIPSAKSKIEQQVASYRLKERLVEHKSQLTPGMPAHREFIKANQQNTNTP